MTLPGRARRRLTGIEGALASDAKLVSLFAMFNALNRGEPASGPEPLPRYGWRSQGPWLPRVAALVVMVAVIVGGLLLSAATRPTGRSCPLIAAGGKVAVPVTGRELLCHAYPANK